MKNYFHVEQLNSLNGGKDTAKENKTQEVEKEVKGAAEDIGEAGEKAAEEVEKTG